MWLDIQAFILSHEWGRRASAIFSKYFARYQHNACPIMIIIILTIIMIIIIIIITSGDDYLTIYYYENMRQNKYNC
jgi:hypothetical protein